MSALGTVTLPRRMPPASMPHVPPLLSVRVQSATSGPRRLHHGQRIERILGRRERPRDHAVELARTRHARSHARRGRRGGAHFVAQAAARSAMVQRRRIGTRHHTHHGGLVGRQPTDRAAVARAPPAAAAATGAVAWPHRRPRRAPARDPPRGRGCGLRRVTGRRGTSGSSAIGSGLHVGEPLRTSASAPVQAEEVARAACRR